MHTTKLIQKNLIERFSEPDQTGETPQRSLVWEVQGRQARHLNQFFKTAEHRKRQILEKMLMD
jgi:hypothetical protein